MQTLANTLNMPIKVVQSDEAPALGASIYAAVAAGIYPTVQQAAEVMGSPFEAFYYPQEEEVSQLLIELETGEKYPIQSCNSALGRNRSTQLPPALFHR